MKRPRPHELDMHFKSLAFEIKSGASESLRGSLWTCTARAILFRTEHRYVEKIDLKYSAPEIRT
jgi:hypothetical protein